MTDPIVIKRVLPCGKRQLFDAWSKPSLMMKWFFAVPQPRMPSTVNNSFTVGGSYEVIMHMESGDFRHYGNYSAIDRYHHIVFTWNSHLIRDSLVELNFRELSPNRTELTLTHTEFPNDDVRSKHESGWRGCLDNLGLFIEEQGTTGQRS
jgi:uncharacterized protein YndB with AHSA1/START domain